MAEISQSRIASIPQVREQIILLTPVCQPEQPVQQSQHRETCVLAAAMASSRAAGQPSAQTGREQSRLDLLVPLVPATPGQEKLNCRYWELSRLQAQLTVLLVALAWGIAQPHHALPGTQQSRGEQSARVWQQLLARPHQESISFLVYSESYSEFTVWD